ncbi:MAG TPA: hypothetical protein VFI49_08110 [Rudaea sp.]|nr:hypothetical protein [Rudaea sp.]
MNRGTRSRDRVKQTGKGKSHSFLRLPHFLTDSEEFGALRPPAVKLLVEIARQFRGSNNGDLSVPWKLLKRRGWASEWTVKRARDELLTAGFIRKTRHGLRKMCHLYAITWEPINECPGKLLEIDEETVASHAWRKHVLNCHHSSRETVSTATTAVKAA